jgi:4-hydroxy-3-polyprenylbenzoate decarboxylase
MRLIIAISGSSGVIYGIRLLELTSRIPDLETHLVMSAAAKVNLAIETGWSARDVERLASHVHDVRDLAASISSGSFRTDGMIVAPCSIKTLSSIAACYSDNLLSRAADVVLKERRRLVLLVRETPLHAGHCRLLLQACEMGAIVMPPVPAFYTVPKTLDDIVNHTCSRALDLFGVETGKIERWSGPRAAREKLKSAKKTSKA